MSEVRLTMAQALVRFLANQYVERDGEEQTLLRRLLRHLRPRQRRGHRTGAPGVRGRPDLLPVAQRAGHGPRRRRLRPPEEPPPDDGVHLLHRTGRHEHGHRGRPRHDKPPARPAAPGGRLRLARAGSGAPAARGAARRGPHGQRRFQARLQVLGQDQPPRADHPRGPRRHARPYEPRRDGRRDPRPAPGRPGRGLRLPRGVFRAARVARRAAVAGRGGARAGGGPDPGFQAAHDRLRRRRHLLGGDGDAARLRRTDRHPRRRDPGGQGLDALRPPARARGRRRHRHLRRQPGRPRRGPGYRGRHPLERLHHRLEDRLPEPGSALRQRERRRLRRRQARGCKPRRGRQGDPRGTRRGPLRLRGGGRLQGGERRGQRRVGRRGRSGCTPWSTGRCRRRAR